MSKIKTCSRCHREAGIFSIHAKGYMGFWGADCLFKLKGLYRNQKGQWTKKGWTIRRLNAPETPKEFAQSSIRQQLERAKDKAKTHAGFWHRVALECAGRRSGISALGYFRETFMVRTIARLAFAFRWKAPDHEQLVNEAIARRFPGARIETEVTET